MENKHDTPEQVYNEFWKDIIEKDGIVDMEALKNELYDFHLMLEEVPKVYCGLTGGLISKPNTYAFEVITQAEKYRKDSFNSTTLDDIEDMAKDAKTVEELMEEIRDYLAADE